MSRGKKIWLNGSIQNEADVRLSLFTHALHYGTGAFEGIRAYKQTTGGGAVFRLPEHMDRLLESVKILGFRAAHSCDELVAGALETCRANQFQECYLRPIAYLGDGPLGVYPGDDPKVEVAILAWVWGKYLGDEGVQKGVKLMTSTFIRPHVNSLMTKGKISGQYVTGVLAKTEAKQNGFDEALMLDPEGFLAEGTGENLFMVRDGVVKTTPLTSILSGITRSTVMTLLQEMNQKVVEARFTRDELWCADEVFLTGTAAEITPVHSIDRRVIGDGQPGAISVEIQKQYGRLVRGDLRRPEWLTAI